MIINNGYSINREQYKKIKKMDHKQMDNFFKAYSKNLASDISTKGEVELVKDDNYKCIVLALENTKGIGEKIRDSFLKNYEAVVKNFVNAKENKNVK